MARLEAILSTTTGGYDDQADRSVGDAHRDKPNHRVGRFLRGDSVMSDEDNNNEKDWVQYQQTEIDEATEEIEDRLRHISGRVQDGILDGDMVNEHQNKRLKAYLEGYADALQYSKRRVERIDNLVEYAIDNDE